MSSDKKDGVNKFARYSSMGIQMAIIIGFSSWLGVYLDQQKNPPGTLYTVLLSLSGVAIALYLVIKEVIKMSKDN